MITDALPAKPCVGSLCLNLANLPVIAITALAMSGDRESCLAAGANEYMSKPLHLQELLEMIRILLRM
jgi:CheY-like chemotaxis protein